MGVVAAEKGDDADAGIDDCIAVEQAEHRGETAQLAWKEMTRSSIESAKRNCEFLFLLQKHGSVEGGTLKGNARVCVVSEEIMLQKS